MATIRLIRRRIKTAKNIAQITKAMELVAASKMKKAQSIAVSGKLYAEKIYTMVLTLASRSDVTRYPLLSKPRRLSGRRLIILISTNKGLCGGLNTNLFRRFFSLYHTKQPYDVVTVGSKGAMFAVRIGANLKADFSHIVPFTNAVSALTDLITSSYLAGSYDGVDLVFNDFVSVMRQEPKQKVILPLTLDSLGEDASRKLPTAFLIEPSVDEVFAALLPHYLENQVRDAILQAQASEHSARMVAMRNATDNAIALMDELTLLYNKARQEKITYEITDMVTARLAVQI